MSFGSPWLLLTLLALPLLVVVHRRAARRRIKYAVSFTNLDVLASVAPQRSWRRVVAPVLLLLALAALCMGIARPHREALVPSEQATVILVLDVSRSMESHDIPPTRLTAAKHAIELFLDRVPKKVRVGLILFAGEPQVAAPPSTDRSLVRESLDFADFFSGFGGTAIGDALAAAVTLARQTVPGLPTSTTQTVAFTRTAPASPVTILFLSDGHQTRGLLQPQEGALQAKIAGIPVYTVSLGTPGGTLDPGAYGDPFGGGGGGNFGRPFNVAPDPATLRAIARTTGGKFFAARSPKKLQAAYSSLGSQLGRTPAQEEITSRFVLLAALLLLAAGVASRLRVPRLP